MKHLVKKLIITSAIAGSFIFVPNIYNDMQIKTVLAEIKPYSGEGKYIASEYEEPANAKERAKQKALQNIRDQAGVYIANYSKSQNYQLVANELTTITNNIVNIIDEPQYTKKPFNLDGEIGMMYIAKVTANVDTDGIKNYLNRNEKDKSNMVSQAAESQQAAAENEKQIETLKSQIKNAKTVEQKNQLKTQFARVENDFKVNQKTDTGNKYYYEQKYSEAANNNNYADALKMKEFTVSGTSDIDVSKFKNNVAMSKIIAKKSASVDAYRKCAMIIQDYLKVRTKQDFEEHKQLIAEMVQRADKIDEKVTVEANIVLKLQEADVNKLKEYLNNRQ